MISREPTIERLAIAQRLLLEPFGLNETHLLRALGEITARKVDDADLYFQYTRSEGWSLEEGIVKTGSFSIDQGGPCTRDWTPLPRSTARPRSNCWNGRKSWRAPRTRAWRRSWPDWPAN